MPPAIDPGADAGWTRRRCVLAATAAVLGGGSWSRAAGVARQDLDDEAASSSPPPPSPPAPATALPAAASAVPIGEPFELAAGVFVVRGAAGGVDETTLGRVANSGFILGSGGVLAIETGTSHRHGQALLDGLRRATGRTPQQVLITHTRQEVLFGATAFRAAGVPIAMHADAALLMRTRCQTCLRNLQRQLGAVEMAGTELIAPDRLFERDHPIDLGSRAPRVVGYGHSCAPGAVAVFDAASGVLFAGGFADEQRIPDVQDADLPQWLRALDALRTLPARIVVPGHGAPTVPAVFERNARYLRALDERVRELLTRGVPLSALADAAELPAYADWDQYDTIHRRNASLLYLRLEREQLYK